MGLNFFLSKKTYWGRHNELFTHGKAFYRIKSRPLTATASRHDQVMTTRYFVPRCFDVHWNTPSLNWRNCVLYLNTPWKSSYVIKLTVRIRTTCFLIPFVTFWKLIRCHAVTPRWLDDAKEYIKSAWSRQRDYLPFGTRNHGRGCWWLRKLPFSKIIWRLALGF